MEKGKLTKGTDKMYPIRNLPKMKKEVGELKLPPTPRKLLNY